MNRILEDFLTVLKGKPQISETREISTPPIREKLILDSLVCPYCSSPKFVKRGWRQKKLERVQLLLCLDCHKTFTPQSVKGKHYPLATIFDAISLYNLGYSLEEACRKTNSAVNGPATSAGNEIGTASGGVSLSAATLSGWLDQFKDNLPFLRMRDFATSKYKPQDMIITATLAHRQLYRFRFHRAKCQMVMQEHFHHRLFSPLREFLEMVPGECPHQYFQRPDAGVAIFRASESPLTFSKTAMIVRGKANYATKLASFVLQGAKERKDRHEILQKFMLYNDSVTVATEVPVYLTRDDLEHMKTQLGFQIFGREIPNSKLQVPNKSKIQNSEKPVAEVSPDVENRLLPIVAEMAAAKLPKLITGHIDILQIRNGMIHLLDFKPNAEKERPIEQLTLYAMALSRLTGLRLFEFKCAWFDEKDYFEFFPLHVLHKPKRARRRKKVETKEGTYQVNKDESKIGQIRPISPI